MHISGTNPNTGDRVDEWNCAKYWKVFFQMQMVKKLDSLAAEISHLRAEQAVRETAALNLAIGLDRGAQQVRALTARTLEADN
jgi:hypothetical protein